MIAKKVFLIRLNLQKSSKYLLMFFLFVILAFACKEQPKGNPERFKQGVFEVPAGNNYSKTIITRMDSLQIEEYIKKISISTDSGVFEKEIKHIDTLTIKWKNNFAYTLWMQNPKTDLDKDPIFVQINKVTDSSYNFKARIGYSKFTTDGIVVKKK